ncbi:hypothetical protein [Longimicrobium sp.]|uniref:hypothetical protein n=1 Tax=Longimicrobium sp. TaxID=2029185 RepID=UPI002ED7E30A
MVETIRAAARQRTGATSLRAVSRQVRMSPSGLSKFLAGARPYSKTLGRLRAWYLWHREQSAALSPEEALAALQLLTSPVPVRRRPELAQAVVAALRESFGGHPPAWWTEFERMVDETMHRSPRPEGRKHPRRAETHPLPERADAGLLT